MQNTSHEKNISTKQPKKSPHTRIQGKNEHQKWCESLEPEKSQRKKEVIGLSRELLEETLTLNDTFYIFKIREVIESKGFCQSE